MFQFCTCITAILMSMNFHYVVSSVHMYNAHYVIMFWSYLYVYVSRYLCVKIFIVDVIEFSVVNMEMSTCKKNIKKE